MKINYKELLLKLVKDNGELCFICKHSYTNDTYLLCDIDDECNNHNEQKDHINFEFNLNKFKQHFEIDK